MTSSRKLRLLPSWLISFICDMGQIFFTIFTQGLISALIHIICYGTAVMLLAFIAPFAYAIFADTWFIDAFSIWREGDVLGGAVVLLICAVIFIPFIVCHGCLYTRVHFPKLSFTARLIIEIIGLSLLIYLSLKSIIATLALPEHIDGIDFFITSFPAVVGLPSIMMSVCAFVWTNWYFRSKQTKE